MYLDATLMFSEKEEITETCNSKALLICSDVRSITSAGAKAGVSALIKENNGSTLYPFIHVSQAFVGLTSLTIEVQTCDDDTVNPEDSTSTIPADSAWRTIHTSETYTIDNLNNIGMIHLAPFSPSCGRLMRLRYIVVGSPSEGAVSAGIILNN